MATKTEELELTKFEPGEIYSAGTAAGNWDQLDESVGRRIRDFEENGVLDGCGLTIVAGTAVAIAAGLIWRRGRRCTPAAATVDEDDGLWLGADADYYLFYDGQTPYYATAGTANDPVYDICVGTATVSAGTVVAVAEAAKRLTQSDLAELAPAEHEHAGEDISSGTIGDDRLGTNIPRKDGAETVTESWRFSKLPATGQTTLTVGNAIGGSNQVLLGLNSNDSSDRVLAVHYNGALTLNISPLGYVFNVALLSASGPLLTSSFLSCGATNGFQHSATADAAVNQWRFVKASTSTARRVVQAGADDTTIIGVAVQNASPGWSCPYRPILGQMVTIRAGGTLALGDWVKSDATGRAVKATPGQDPEAAIVGYVVGAATVDQIAYMVLAKRGGAGPSLGDATDGSRPPALDATYQVVTTPATADTEFGFFHGLGRVPVAFVVVKKDRACDVYVGPTAWTTTYIHLKCSVASAAITLLMW